MYKFLDDPEKQTFTDSSVTPSEPVAEKRATMVDYALGEKSPGKDKLKESFLIGDEPMIRQQQAIDRDLEDQQLRLDLLSTVAQQSGRRLTKEEADIVRGLTAQELRSDPGSILEQKFSDKYINDLFENVNVYAGFDTSLPKVDAMNVASSLTTNKNYFQTQYENLQKEAQEQSWISFGADVVGQLIPFLPWWRQAQALKERPMHYSLLPGKTMAENITYLYSLPFEERKRQYTEAIRYLKGENMLDAMTFAQAMVSFGTSDELINNSVGIADITSTVGLPILKALGASSRAASGAKIPGAVAGADPVKTATPLTTHEKRLLLTDQRSAEAKATSDRFTQQTDLFGEQPEQGSFRFMGTTPEQTPPTTASKLPPGKLRATHVPIEDQIRGKDVGRDLITGRMYREPTQTDLPLSRPEHQAGFDFGSPTPRPPTVGPETAPIEQIKQAAAAAVKATEGPGLPNPEHVLNAVGRVDEGSTVGALKRILNPLGEGNQDIARDLPTFANPEGFLQSSKVIGRARAQDLAPELLRAGQKLVSDFIELARVGRLPPEALAVAKANAERSLRADYSRMSSSILDIKYTPAEMHPANVDTQTLVLGKTDKLPFDTAEQAKLYRDEIYKLGEKEAKIVPQGYKFVLEIPRHLDETADNVRDAVLTPKNSANGGVINMLLNRLRSTEDLIGDYQRGIRHLATHAPQELRKSIRDYIKDNIENLSRAERRAVEDILRLNRDTPSTTNPGTRGEWYKTSGEFEQAYFNRHNRLPTEKEILAYDAFKRLSDFDWLLRNTAVYRDKARQGVETFRFRFGDQWSGWFEGKRLDKMPWSLGKADQDAGVWLWNTETQTGKFYYKFSMDKAERDAIDKLIAGEGYRVVQVFDAKKHPLKDIATTAAGAPLREQVHYVITNTWDHSPLSWKQVDYSPGGHVIYPNKWYVSQPQMQVGRNGKMTFLGDSNILNVETEAQARKWAEKVDYGRQLLKAGRVDELDAFLARSLPYSRKEFTDLFFRSDSPLSLDHPVVYKEGGKTTIGTVARLKAEVDNGNLVDSTKNIHDLSNFMDKSYLADRDHIIKTINEHNNVLRLGPAEQLDPYSALQRAIGQSIQNVWTTDYKISAVETWIKQFQHVMKPGDKFLTAHPLYALFDKEIWKENISAAAKADLAAGKATQKAIVNFIGARSEFSNATDVLKMKLLNTVYEKVGQGRMLDMALATTSDPVTFLRGVAFHSKLGLFNPIQFVVQAQSMVHAVAVAGPRHGLPGVAAAPLIRALGHNPNQLDAIAGVASRLGWTKDEFKEMYRTFQKTGIYQVAGEAALRDDVFDPKLFRSTFGSFIDAGTMFFNEGERMVRLTAFATAFREFRAANKTLSIGNREIAAIMTRADDLSVNMTRASNAAWQQGVFSVPTQFFAYNARIMEQLLGGRLTGAEKLRMLTLYSAMYGLPIGAGMAVAPLWPVYDSIKQEAMKRGIELNEGIFKQMTEGMNAYALELLTGKQSNVAQRFGPGNAQTIKNVVDGDTSLLGIIFGASGSIVSDFFKATRPFAYYAASLVNGNGEYPIQSSDWMTFFRNISTADLATKAYYASRYGQWITKSGTVVTSGVDSMDAALAFLGLSPREVSDTFLKLEANKQVRAAQENAVRVATEDYRRALQAASRGDHDGYRSFSTRASTALEAADLNAADKAKAFNRIVSQTQDLKDKVNWDSLRHAPASRFDTIFDKTFKK